MDGGGAVLVVQAFDVIVDVVLRHLLHLDTRLQTCGHGHANFWKEPWRGGVGVTLRLVEDLQRTVTFCRGLRWLRGFSGDRIVLVQEEAELRGWALPSSPAGGVWSWTAELVGGRLERSPGEIRGGENHTDACPDPSLQPNRVCSSSQGQHSQRSQSPPTQRTQAEHSEDVQMFRSLPQLQTRLNIPGVWEGSLGLRCRG